MDLMKKTSYLLFTILIFSCASAKLAMIPVGSWDYTITGTPSGDFSGVLTVTMDGDKYSATLKSQAGDLKFDETLYDKKTKSLTGNFNFQGTTIFFESITEGDNMKG